MSTEPTQDILGEMVAVTMSGDAERVERSLARVETRPCRQCGVVQEFRGWVTVCAACDMNPSPEKHERQELGATWPKRHIAKLATMHGDSLRMAQALAPKMVGARLCVLAGNRGLGKTQIATYCAQWRGENGYNPGLYTRAFDMVSRIVGYDRDEKLEQYQRKAFLVIDEVHRLEPRDLPLLESIVDDRYSNDKATMLIGNWLTTEGVHVGEQIDGERINGVGSSLFSRIMEHQKEKTGGIVWCRWKSYRED